MPFVGPFSLGGSLDPSQLPQLESRIAAKYPDAGGWQTYGPDSNNINALGFTSPYAPSPLFSGQPMSTVDAIFANQPKLVEGAGRVQPESVTAATAGVSTPGGGVLQAGLGAPPPLPTMGSGGGGVGGPGAAGTATGGTAGTASGATATGPATSGGMFSGGVGNAISNVGGMISAAQANSPTGQLSQSIGVNPTIGATLAGIVGNAALGPVVGPIAGLANTGLGLANTPSQPGSLAPGMFGQAFTGVPATAANQTIASPMAMTANAAGNFAGMSGQTAPGIGDATAMGMNAADVGNATTANSANAFSGALGEAATGEAATGEAAGNPGSPGSASGGVPGSGENSGVGGAVGEPAGDTAGDTGDAGGGDGGGGGGTVICTELWRQGLLEDVAYAADTRFAFTQPLEVLIGYRAWATPLVRIMRRSKLVTHGVALLALPWARHMAYVMGASERDSRLGAFVMRLGVPLCATLGRRRVLAA